MKPSTAVCFAEQLHNEVFETVLAYQGRQAVGQVVVFEGGRNPLIGCDFIEELWNLRMNKLHMESLEMHEKELKEILDRYGEFSHNLR